ncbi:hypothetical protein D3C73_1163670 [compost metagenome]
MPQSFNRRSVNSLQPSRQLSPNTRIRLAIKGEYPCPLHASLNGPSRSGRTGSKCSIPVTRISEEGPMQSIPALNKAYPSGSTNHQFNPSNSVRKKPVAENRKFVQPPNGLVGTFEAASCRALASSPLNAESISLADWVLPCHSFHESCPSPSTYGFGSYVKSGTDCVSRSPDTSNFRAETEGMVQIESPSIRLRSTKESPLITDCSTPGNRSRNSFSPFKAVSGKQSRVVT